MKLPRSPALRALLAALFAAFLYYVYVSQPKVVAELARKREAAWVCDRVCGKFRVLRWEAETKTCVCKED